MSQKRLRTTDVDPKKDDREMKQNSMINRRF